MGNCQCEHFQVCEHVAFRDEVIAEMAKEGHSFIDKIEKQDVLLGRCEDVFRNILDLIHDKHASNIGLVMVIGDMARDVLYKLVESPE